MDRQRHIGFLLPSGEVPPTERAEQRVKIREGLMQGPLSNDRSDRHQGAEQGHDQQSKKETAGSEKGPDRRQELQIAASEAAHEEERQGQQTRQ